MDSRNQFQAIESAWLCSLEGRYDNTIPTRFLAPIDCYKIPAQVVAEEQTTVLFLIEKIYGRFALGDGKHSTTVAEGRKELDQHGVLSSLTGGQWPGWCDLYCDGRSVPYCRSHTVPYQNLKF